MVFDRQLRALPTREIEAMERIGRYCAHRHCMSIPTYYGRYKILYLFGMARSFGHVLCDFHAREFKRAEFESESA